MSRLQGLGILLTAFFMVGYGLNQFIFYPQSTVPLLQQAEKCHMLAHLQSVRLDEAVLGALNETFQSLSSLASQTDSSYQIVDALGITMDQFNQLENKYAKLQALMKDEIDILKQDIALDLTRLMNTYHDEGMTQDFYTALSLRYDYMTSLHDLTYEALEKNNLQHCKETILTCLNKIESLLTNQEAGKKFVLVQKLKEHFVSYLSIVQSSSQQWEDLQQTQGFLKKQVQFFVSKIDIYEKSLLKLRTAWLIGGLVVLASVLVMFIITYLRTMYLMRQYGLYTKNLNHMLQRIHEKNQFYQQERFLSSLAVPMALNSSQSSQTPQPPQSQPASSIAVPGFSLSTIAQEMHSLVEKTTQLTNSMDTYTSLKQEEVSKTSVLNRNAS